MDDCEQLFRVVITQTQLVKTASEAGTQSEVDSVVIREDISERLQQLDDVVLFFVVDGLRVLQERLYDKPNEIVLA